MIRRFGIVASAGIALFAGIHASAQSQVAVPSERTASSPQSAGTATPPMWRVTDADSEFILLGTFHILPPGLEWRTQALETAITEAQTVYFEVEADADDAQAKTLNVLMLQGFNKPGVTLSEMLDPADALRLKTISKELGLPFAGINPMRPWRAFLTLSVQFIIQQGFQPGSGVDSVLMVETRTLGKDLRFFETLEEQLGLFTSLSPETEKSLLVLTLHDWENQKTAFDDLFDAWKTGNAEFIDEQMNVTMRRDAPEVFDRLIVKRNKAWAKEIAKVMNDGAGTALVAVGAGHLVGDDYSVPALLAAKGFEVSRYGLETDPAQTPANDNIASGQTQTEPADETQTDDDISDLLESLNDEG